MTNPTQHEKILAIAKAMYGESSLSLLEQFDFSIGVYITIKDSKELITKQKFFNPYTSAEDSQAVQEFLKIDADHEADRWCAYHSSGHSINQDLKTAIADCAYEAVKEIKIEHGFCCLSQGLTSLRQPTNGDKND